MYEEISTELTAQIIDWEQKLKTLDNKSYTIPRNSQNRNIKQIVGHMIDSASNNTHRVVLLQYREVPLRFHNYATNGNNDRWISIQNYEQEVWEHLIQHWKYSHLHFLHVIQQIDKNKLNNEWFAAVNEKVTLKAMVEDFPRHFNLHISEIEELLNT